jgi:hypothetical protein
MARGCWSDSPQISSDAASVDCQPRTCGRAVSSTVSTLKHLQQFLLELGTGFCFEARQKRITVGTKHDYIDLVFYQRRLRCHVLLDLKVRPFSHGDAGQMNFYLNWWKKNGMERGDKPPVGIILCSDREKTEVEFATAGMDNTLFVSRYQVALPSPKQLQEFIERDREEIEAKMTKGRT